jgi:hypothetical protein
LIGNTSTASTKSTSFAQDCRRHGHELAGIHGGKQECPLRWSERVSFASRSNDVPNGLQRFDTVGNDFEHCQEGHGKERAGNPPDRMPKEQ